MSRPMLHTARRRPMPQLDRIFLVRGTLDRAVELSREGDRVEVIIQRRRWPFPEHTVLARTALVYIAGPLEPESEDSSTEVRSMASEAEHLESHE